MPNAGPKSTIYIASIPSNLDRSDAYHFFETLSGFKRFCFHQDYAFVVFESPEHAKSAIDYTHANSDMLAAYAKNDIQPSNINNMVQLSSSGAPGSAGSNVPSIAPNPTLYIAIPSYFTDKDMSKIVRNLEGLEHIRYFPGHCLVRFQSTALAAKALQLLSSRTNLSMNFSSKGASKQEHHGSQLHHSFSMHHHAHPSQHTEGASLSASSKRATAKPTTSSASIRSSPDEQQRSVSPKPGSSKTAQTSLVLSPSMFPYSYNKTGLTTSPKRTIHVTNIMRDKTAIKQLMESLPGFQRIAFYLDYCFVVFDSVDDAASAIDSILAQSKMKASFAKADFTPHEVPESQVGVPNAIVRVSDYPSFMTDVGLRSLFGVYEGASDIHFYHSSCLIHFDCVDNAEKCLRDINKTTNFVAVFSRKGAALASAQAGSASASQHRRNMSTGSIIPKSDAGSKAYWPTTSSSPGEAMSPPPAASAAASGSTTPVSSQRAIAEASAAADSLSEMLKSSQLTLNNASNNGSSADSLNSGSAFFAQTLRNSSGDYSKPGSGYEPHDLTSFLHNPLLGGTDLASAAGVVKAGNVGTLSTSLSSCSLSSAASNSSSSGTINHASAHSLNSIPKRAYAPSFPHPAGTAADFSAYTSLLASNSANANLQAKLLREQWEQQRAALSSLSTQLLNLQLEFDRTKTENTKLKAENRELRALLMLEGDSSQPATASADSAAHISPLYVSNLLSIID